ncbi:MarR family winged helix-turn-helix transcriptional regulator [Roseibium polysiphoniae]|nr:MarR family winged helix-turn-helix transcriptional regulator [Roseibium polysiphoniae]
MTIVTEKNEQNLSERLLASDMLKAKLWENPCPFSFRLNYLALLYNSPLYTWVEERYGLRRPEYVVLYSLAISNGGSAMDVSRTSGFPKNTLSRAIKRLRELGLIDQHEVSGIGPRQILGLTPEGRVLFDETMPTFAEIEKRMLACLTTGERQILLEILSKIVLNEEDWSGTLPTSDDETGQDHLETVHD